MKPQSKRKALGGETYACEICTERKPFAAFGSANGRRADYCRECTPFTPEEFADPKEAKNMEAGAAWYEKARETTPCTYCKRVKFIDAWYKRDGESVDFDRHLQHGYEVKFLKKIAGGTTPLCKDCSDVRFDHPVYLHKQLKKLFFDVQRAAKSGHSPWHKRLLREYQAMQKSVRLVDLKWATKKEVD